MLIESKEKDACLVVKLVEKRLDAHISVVFKEKLVGFVNDEQKNIILDLSDVEFIDSSGLGAIVSALKHIGSTGGSLSICGLQDATLSMFKLTRMDKVFNIYPNENEALAAAA